MDEDSDRVTDGRWDARGDNRGLHNLVFTRDALIGFVPIGGRSYYRGDFQVTLEDSGTDAARSSIVRLLSRSHRYGLTDSFCDFAEEVGSLLVTFGEATYEIVRGGFGHDELEINGTPQPRLEQIAPPTLKRLGPLVVQVLPRVAREGGVPIVRVPIDKLWWISLPTELGSPYAHRRMLKRLARVEAATGRLNPLASPKGFDSSAAKLADDAESVRLVRNWGVLSFMKPQHTTSYFDIAGQLANDRVKAVVREHVVTEFNSLLSRLNLPHIKIEGLPTSTEIAQVLSRLRAGDIDFKQAIDQTRF